MGRGTYAKGKWALGECARSGRKMLLRNMIADGYYPNLIVDPEWYDPKHPQESLPSVKDPVTLYKPAPDRDRVGGVLLLGGADDPDSVPGGGFGQPVGGDFAPSQVVTGYEIGTVGFNAIAASNHAWDCDSTSTPEPDDGVGPDGPFDLGYGGGGPVTTTSLRVDATGAAHNFAGVTRAQSVVVELIYSNGFSVEYAVRPTTIGGRSVGGGFSRIIPSVHSHINNPRGIFELGFDNWDNEPSIELKPNFVILSPDANYDAIEDRVSILGEARGTTILTTLQLNRIYHLCGTLSATGRCRLYVNGVLEATASPDINMTDFIGTGQEDLSSAARTQRKHFETGTRFLSGSYRIASNSGAAHIDEVRWYDSELSASDVAAKAALINFT